MDNEPTLLNDDPTEPEPQTTEPQEPAPQKTEPQETAPVEYDLKFPEGFEVDKDVLEEFKPLAKELKLSPEHAQKLVDMQAKMAQKMAEANTEAFNAMVNGWADAAKSDKEFGGAKFDENLSIAKTALDKFGSMALKEALGTSGMGNHPEVIRLLWNAGKAMKSMGTVVGGTQVNEPINPAKVLFPNQN